MGLEPAAVLKPTLTAPPGEPASLSESQAQKYHGLSLVLAEEGETHFWREGGSPPSWGGHTLPNSLEALTVCAGG